jgi:hypothetical protein
METKTAREVETKEEMKKALAPPAWRVAFELASAS